VSNIRYITRGKLIGASEMAPSDYPRPIDLFRIDLELLAVVGESDEDAYARNERVMLAAASEVERLKPIAGRPVGEEVRPDERQQMRAVIEAMRPIVEAAIEWQESPEVRAAWRQYEVATLYNAVRDNGTLVRSAISKLFAANFGAPR
jgi:hypothetical protein